MTLKDKLLGLIGLSVAGLMMFSCTEVKEANYQIIPMPLDIQLAEQGKFVLTEGTSVIYPENNEKMQNNANFLAEYVKEKTGITLAPTTEAKRKGIILKVEENKEKPEGYTLKVTTDNVTICGGSEAGVFYGIQTLRKSLPVVQGEKVALPAVEINDEPRFDYRGGMLDVARHYIELDSVKRFIDMLAMHNINRFHWHLSEDQGWRIEIKCRPLLTEKGSMRKETIIGKTDKYDGKPHGGFFTQEEAKEIVKYAADRYITVIPEIDMPGHMLSALHAYPELGCTGGPYDVWCHWGVSKDVLCAGNDATLKFIEDVLGEIVEIFPSEYIHIGGDECPKTRWESCPKCQARIKALGIKGDEKHTAEEYLQSFIINYAEKFLNSKGRQIIGWDEILEGGLAPNATVMSWRGEKGGIEAAHQKHKVIMTPHTYLYFDYYQSYDRKSEPLAIGGKLPLERVYSYNPLPKELSAEEQKYIIGVQANLWTEYISTFKYAEYMLLPRLAALSEIQWSSADKRNYECFLSRLPRLVELYDLKQYNYATHAFNITSNLVQDTNEGVVKVALKTIDNCPIHYTLDGTEPTASSPLYEDTLKIKEACTINAVGIRPNIKTRIFTQKVEINKAEQK
ncbi:MAG: family 20 glycosylhydrolase [Bacteroidaceae bacterium]|nr:family 20 glycosylhydrolase [Bacteroidaceae bacterium]